MHCHAAERADLILSNFNNSSESVDSTLMEEREH